MIRNTELLTTVVLATLLGACDQKSPDELEKERKAAAQPTPHTAKTSRPTTETLPSNPWWEDLSITQAGKKAQAEGKTVFVAVYSRTCPMCGKMERDVFEKEDVRAFLKKRTVPIKVDCEDNKLFSTLHKISGVPTILFLRPDGTEIDRMVGGMPHDTFLELATDFAAGRDRVAIAQREVTFARYGNAAALAQKGKHKKALQEYLEVLDTCMESTYPYDDLAVRVVDDLYVLGETSYEKARKALRSRAKAARKRLLSGTGETKDMQLVCAVYQLRDKPASALSLYDKLKDKYSDKDQWAVWTEEVLDPLLAERRYEDIGASIQIKEAVDRIFAEAKEREARAADFTDQATILIADGALKRLLAYEVSRYYQVLIGLKRFDEANQLAARLLKAQPGAETLNALAWAGYLTGHPTEENLRQAREAYKKAHTNRAAVADTLARILAARGHREEALDVLNKAIKLYRSRRDQEILKVCLAEIEQQEE